MQLRPRWLIITLGVFLLVVAIGAGLLVHSWPFSQDKIVQSVQESWQGTVKIEKHRNTYFPHPGCVVENVSFAPASTPPDAPPLVTAKSVTIQANYPDLFFRRGYVSRLIVEGLQIKVTRNNSQGSTAKSQSNPNDPPTIFGEIVTDNAVLEIAHGEKKEPLRFEIHHLFLNSVRRDSPLSYEVAMRNATPPGEIHATGKFGPWQSKDHGQTTLSGDYTFEGADLGVFHGISGTLSSKGSFQGVLSHIAMQGTTDTPDFVTRGKHEIPLKTKFDAVVNGTNGDTILNEVDASFFHTTARIHGAITSQPGQPGKTTTLNIAVHEGRIENVLRIFVREKNAPMEGATNFTAHVTLPPGHRPFLEKVTLDGDFTVTGGRFTNPAKQTSLENLSKRARGIKLDKKTEKGEEKKEEKSKEQRDIKTGEKVPVNSIDPENTNLNLSGHISLAEAIANFRDLKMDVGGAEALMKGKYALETEQIDFHGDLKTESELSDTTTGVKAVLLKPLDPLFKKKHAGAVIPVGMTGTYKDPHFGIEILKK